MRSGGRGGGGGGGNGGGAMVVVVVVVVAVGAWQAAGAQLETVGPVLGVGGGGAAAAGQCEGSSAKDSSEGRCQGSCTVAPVSKSGWCCSLQN